jgi:hypothetical protein
VALWESWPAPGRGSRSISGARPSTSACHAGTPATYRSSTRPIAGGQRCRERGGDGEVPTLGYQRDDNYVRFTYRRLVDDLVTPDASPTPPSMKEQWEYGGKQKYRLSIFRICAALAGAGVASIFTYCTITRYEQQIGERKLLAEQKEADHVLATSTQQHKDDRTDAIIERYLDQEDPSKRATLARFVAKTAGDEGVREWAGEELELRNEEVEQLERDLRREAARSIKLEQDLEQAQKTSNEALRKLMIARRRGGADEIERLQQEVKESEERRKLLEREQAVQILTAAGTALSSSILKVQHAGKWDCELRDDSGAILEHIQQLSSLSSAIEMLASCSARCEQLPACNAYHLKWRSEPPHPSDESRMVPPLRSR